MPAKVQDLRIVALCTLGGVVAVIIKLPIPFVRVIITLPLVLILPGYALVAALFPRRLPRLAERWVMAVALSFSISAISGLLLNWSAQGLTESSWLLVLPGVTWGACMVALVRRRMVNDDFPPFRGESILRYAVVFGILLCFGTVALGLARFGEAVQPQVPFTTLSVVRTGGNRGMEIQISNEEQASHRYRLSILLNGIAIKQIDTFMVGRMSLRTLQLELPDSVSGKLEIILYKADNLDTAYRSLILWM